VPRVLVPLVWHLTTGKPTVLSEVAARLFDGMTPTPRIIGDENIPPDSSFIVIFNHYESSSAAAWWGPLLVARAIAARRTLPPYEVNWIMAREWWYPGGFGRAVKQPFTHALFARLARVFGLILVPPILKEPATTRGEGVAGVRHALEMMRHKPTPLIGLAPEGRTGPDARLCEPPSGTGIFLSLLAHHHLPLLPVAWYQEDGKVMLHFGSPFTLRETRGARDERDRAAATEAMLAIARLLPETLRGGFSRVENPAPNI
jgi:hypothetical protein